MKYSLRDVFWLTLVVAILVGWWLQWKSTKDELARINSLRAAQKTLGYLENVRSETAQTVEHERERLAELEAKLALTSPPSRESAAISLEVEFAKGDMQRAEMRLRKLEERMLEIALARLGESMVEKRAPGPNRAGFTETPTP